jgi:hypothetical protein
VASHASPRAWWWQPITIPLQYTQHTNTLFRSTLVYCDNIIVVYLSVQHRHTKHVEIHLHFVQERVVLLLGTSAFITSLRARNLLASSLRVSPSCCTQCFCLVSTLVVARVLPAGVLAYLSSFLSNVMGLEPNPCASYIYGTLDPI